MKAGGAAAQLAADRAWCVGHGRVPPPEVGPQPPFELMGHDIGMAPDAASTRIHARIGDQWIVMKLDEALRQVDMFAEPGRQRILDWLPKVFDIAPMTDQLLPVLRLLGHNIGMGDEITVRTRRCGALLDLEQALFRIEEFDPRSQGELLAAVEFEFGTCDNCIAQQ